MRNSRHCAPLFLILILSFLSSSCLWTHRVILRGGKPVAAGAAVPLIDATRSELNDRIAKLYNAINSFQATVQMTPSIGSVYKGKITDIKNIKAFVLFRKPNNIRIIGQLPVVGTKEFDMVSTADRFKFLEVSKNLFFTGSNNTPPTSPSALENLRPEAFLSSMLIRPAIPGVETPVLEDETDEEGALYVLHFIRGQAPGLLAGRSVWFDRIDFSIVRQIVYDNAGSIVSDTRYSKWKAYDAVQFPSHIDINRPKDGYGVTMDIQQMKMNLELTDDKFELDQPPGTQLRRVGEPK
jgi:outer membrane lipoprotein-sorting protein